MKHRLIVPALVLAALLVACGSALAVPQMVQYQGRLTDAAGNPLNGPQTALFTIYDDSLGTNTLWSEKRTVTPVNGVFDITLGMANPVNRSAFNGADRFLGIRVWPDSTADMEPRQRISSNAYAIQAGYADVAGSSTSFARGASSANTTLITGQWVNYTSAQVSITTTGPGYVVVTSDFDMIISPQSGVPKFIEVGISTAPTGGPSGGGPDIWFYYSNGGVPTATTYNNGHVTATFAVNGAGTYTYYLVGYIAYGLNGDNFNYANLTAVFHNSPNPSIPALKVAADKKLIP